RVYFFLIFTVINELKLLSQAMRPDQITKLSEIWGILSISGKYLDWQNVQSPHRGRDSYQLLTILRVKIYPANICVAYVPIQAVVIYFLGFYWYKSFDLTMKAQLPLK